MSPGSQATDVPRPHVHGLPPFVTVMDISATDRNPEPGDDPLLFSTDSKGSFRCTQPQTVMHTTKPLLNQLGTTGICPHRSNQPTQDSNPGPSDHESQTLCVSPPSEDQTTLFGQKCPISVRFICYTQQAIHQLRNEVILEHILDTRSLLPLLSLQEGDWGLIKRCMDSTIYMFQGINENVH